MRPRLAAVLSASLLALTFAVAPSTTALADTTSCAPYGGTVTCTVTTGPGSSNWTVPVGVTQVTFKLRGAQGGQGGLDSNLGGGSGGGGGESQGTITVAPGQVFQLSIGGAGGQAGGPWEYGRAGTAGVGGGGTGGAADYRGTGGGGGGGATILTTGGSAPSLLLEAGGGGGGGGQEYQPGGSGGGGGNPGGGGGQGAMQSGGGGGGGTLSAGGGGGGPHPYYIPASTVGGNGGRGTGGFGGRGSYNGAGGAGGGGGGGYNGGGGGGGGYTGGGGGGGASYASSSLTAVSFQTGVQGGNGAITIAYPDPRVSTSTSLGSAPNPSTVGTAVSLTATVTPSLVTGTVQFLIDGANSGSPVALSGGVATYSIASLSTGAHTASAVYSGDPTYGGSIGVLAGGQVVQGPVPLTWPAPGSIAAGTGLSAAHLNATASVPGSFAYSPALGTVLGVGPRQPLSVTFTPADTTNYLVTTMTTAIDVTAANSPYSLVLGTDAAWTYDAGGAAGLVPSSCSPWTLAAIAPAQWIYEPLNTCGGDSATHSYSRDFTVDGQVVSARLEIAADDSAAVTVNGTSLGSCCNSSAITTLDLSSAVRSGANHLVIANTNLGGPGGLLARLTVQIAPPTTLTVNSARGTLFGAAAMSATLAAAGAAVSGKVITFSVNGTAVCGGSTGVTCPLTGGDGVASLGGVSLAGIVAGTYPGAVTASFAGDTSFVGSRGSGALTVDRLPVSVAVSSSRALLTAGENITFTAALAPPASTGTVQFQIDGGPAGSPVTVIGGSAAFSTSALTAGYHWIDAIYNGDIQHAPAGGSLPGGQTVASLLGVSSCQDSGAAMTCTITAPGPFGWTVPAGVTQVTFDVKGAQGGHGASDYANNGGGNGGLGGEVTASLAVSTGQTFQFVIGGAGSDAPSYNYGRAGGGGYGGGGGGGASSMDGDGGGGGGGETVLTTGGNAPATLIEAGGGGGGGGQNYFNGGPGGAGGNPGTAGAEGAMQSGGPGGGGTLTAGGGGGAAHPYYTPDSTPGGAGSRHAGGYGGRGIFHYQGAAGGGGGGGYYGGGGAGGGYTGGGGGGGSSYADPSLAGVTYGTGVAAGNGSVTITYSKPATTTTVTSSNASSAFSSAVVFTAAVSPIGASGSVQFQIDGVNAGSPVSLVSGSATYTTSGLAVGSHTVSATYAGGSTFAGSTGSLAGGQAVIPAATQLIAEAANGISGSATSLSATLRAGGAPLAGRAVSFTINGTPVCGGATGTPCPISAANGVATLPGVSLVGVLAGSYPSGVGAAFAGDSSYLSSSAAAALSLVNPLPVLGGSSPASVLAGSADTTVTLSGSGFVPGSTVQWDGSGLATTFASATQLTAIVPAARLAAAGAHGLAVTNPAPGGGTSASRVLIVTNSAVTVAAEAVGTAVGGRAAVSLPSSAGVPGVSATGSGSGSISIAQFQGNPASAATFNTGSGGFIDVAVLPGSSFTSLSIQLCALNGNRVAYWFDGTRWRVAGNQVYDPATGCLTITVDRTTSPTVAQLGGTAFATGLAPVATPVATAAGGAAYTAGTWSPVPVTVSFLCAAGGAPVTASAPVVLGDGLNQTATGTCTDGAGAVTQAQFGPVDVDQAPPVLSLPAPITATATSTGGAVVLYSATAIDAAAGVQPTVTCSMPSGTTFAIGLSSVDCSAANAAGIVARGSFTVNVLPLPTSLTAAPATGVYGGLVTLAATLSAAGTPVIGQPIAFTLAGNPVCGAAPLASCPLTDAAGTATLAGVSLGGLHARSYSSHVGATFGGTQTYAPSAGRSSLTVTQAPLTITADSLTKVYGQPLPALTATYSGLTGGDTAASLGTAPSISTTATASSHVAGSPYSITAAGAVDSDYSITYGTGTLTVTPAPLQISANNQSKVYGGPLPTLTATYTGLVNGDRPGSLTAQPSLTTAATTGSHVAGSPYSITATGAVDSDYSITYAAGALTVTPAALTITADDKSKVYGDPLPALTASFRGLVNGDLPGSLGTAPTITTTALSSSDVGSYPVTAAGAASTDYSITYALGTLTITQAPLAVVVAGATHIYHQPNPTFSGTVTGVVNGDAILALYSTALDASTPAGTYPNAITATLSGSHLSNYLVSLQKGTLTVTQMPTTLALTTSEFTAAQSGPAVITARLSESLAPTGLIAGQRVTCTLSGGRAATGVTDSNGVATCTFTGLGNGQYPVNAGFAGDPNYVASTAAAQTLYVYQPTQFVIWGGNQPANGQIKPGYRAQFYGEGWSRQISRPSGDEDSSGDGSGSSFRGYADTLYGPLAAGSLFAAGGRQSRVPLASVPTYISVIVTTHLSGGDQVLGDVSALAILKVEPARTGARGEDGEGDGGGARFGTVVQALPGYQPTNTVLSGEAENDGAVLPGDSLKVGYQFQIAGRHAAAQVSVTGAQAWVTARCATGATQSFEIAIADRSYSAPANSSWQPPLNPADPLGSAQGGAAAPDLCAGQPYRIGATLFGAEMLASSSQSQLRAQYMVVNATALQRQGRDEGQRRQSGDGGGN